MIDACREANRPAFMAIFARQGFDQVAKFNQESAFKPAKKNQEAEPGQAATKGTAFPPSDGGENPGRGGAS